MTTAPPMSPRTPAQTASSGVMATAAITRGTTRNPTRSQPQCREGADLGYFHRPQFGSEGGTGTSGQDDRGQQRTKFTQHGEADQIGDVEVRSEFRRIGMADSSSTYNESERNPRSATIGSALTPASSAVNNASLHRTRPGCRSARPKAAQSSPTNAISHASFPSMRVARPICSTGEAAGAAGSGFWPSDRSYKSGAAPDRRDQEIGFRMFHVDGSDGGKVPAVGPPRLRRNRSAAPTASIIKRRGFACWRIRRAVRQAWPVVLESSVLMIEKMSPSSEWWCA